MIRLARLSLALLALLGAGCDRTKMRECNLLSERINAGVSRVDALEKERLERPEGGPTQTAQAMKKASVLYEDLANDVNKLDLTERELKNLSLDYSSSLKTTSGAAEALARAIASDERGAATAADSIYASSIAKQKAAIDKINAFCAR